MDSKQPTKHPLVVVTDNLATTYQDPIIGGVIDAAIIGLAVLAPQLAIPLLIGQNWLTRSSAILEDRLRTLFDPLVRAKNQQEIVITDEMLKSEDFIHAVTIITTASLRTRQREKIRRFAYLLIAGIKRDSLGDAIFYDFAQILDDLSETELNILRLLQQYEDSHPHEVKENGETENDMGRAMHFWDNFVEDLVLQIPQLTKDMIPAYLTRLTRTGLYQSFVGIYLGNKGENGKTTPLFREFSQWIYNEHMND